MNYETEAWYKLYIRESTEDKVLPVLNRSLRDFLLRTAKSRDDGTVLGKTASPSEDLARALGAHASEMTMVAGFIETMLADGFLTHRKGRLWITNFVEAQAARSAGARRQKTYREKQSQPRNAAPVSDATVSNASITPASLVTSQEIRSEERREEKNRDETTRERDPVSVVVTSPPDPPDADPGRETACPTDLVSRLEANGTTRTLAEKLVVPIASVVHELQQFEGYWTIGKGAGQKRTGWAGKARQWVVDQHAKPGGLKAPGAVEHERRKRDDPGEYVPSAATKALMGGLVRQLR